MGFGSALGKACSCFKPGCPPRPSESKAKEAAQEVEAPASPILISKKGIGVWGSPITAAAIQDLNVSWYYCWAISPEKQSIEPPSGVIFTPQFYTGADINEANIQIAMTLASDTCVLGMNEPERVDQGFTRIADAVAVWPKLHALNKRLGAPAMATCAANYPTPWFDEFMQIAKQKNLRIDFIAMHWYNDDDTRWDPDVATQDLKITLEAWYQKYKKPLWLTEFGLAKWLSAREAIYPSAETQARFVTKACAMMNGLSFVERYAYFPFIPYTKNSTCHLYETDGTMTCIGEAYKRVK